MTEDRGGRVWWLFELGRIDNNEEEGEERRGKTEIQNANWWGARVQRGDALRGHHHGPHGRRLRRDRIQVCVFKSGKIHM